ncbi:MAG: sulfatase [Rikenellaceae bacterium]
MKNYSSLFKFSAACAPLFTACGSQSTLAEATNHPNVILFVTDDHGLDALGCYGNSVVSTPNLDQLAAEGVRFTNAYCTSASSAASRSVLLTGQFGHAIGAYGHVHDYHHFSTYENVKSLPVLLSENGYYTARIGKYHVAPESVYHFDETYQADPRNTVEMAEVSSEIFNSDTPFFLYFCTDDPHRSDFTTAADDWRSPNRFGNKDEGYDGVETITFDYRDVVVPEFLSDNEETRREIAEYYQSIARVDQGFGRLMKHLKASGKADNTIVIYISDNGMAFPGAKTSTYEAGIKLPCIIKDPTCTIQAAGTTNSSMISWVDMTPTILDMAGVQTDNKFHGRSFKDIIPAEDPANWNKIHASHTFHEITMYYPMRVVRQGRYKLIWNAAHRLEYPFASDLFISSTWQSVKRSAAEKIGGRSVQDFLFRPEFELFDVESDPNEFVNLAAKKEYKEVLDQLVAELQEWQKETSDPWFILWSGDASMQGKGENL